MSEPRYRHTQVGWVMIGLVALVVALVVPRLPGGAPGASFLGLVLGAVLLVFGTLTVVVEREAIRLWFGPGLVRKRIPLASVAGWQAVRNPWYAGWGIRLGPGWTLWNVSGFDAVELALVDGRRFRIGTDEPDALAAAIAAARGEATAVPPPAFTDRPVAPGAGGWTRLVLLVGAIFLGIGVLFWVQMQPPAVTVTPDRLSVRSLFYGADVPAAEIAAVSLERTLPRVLLRTNGFAAAGSLRGHFRVEGLGDGQLFVEAGESPYVLVRLRDGFLVVNFGAPGRTRALHAEMARAWPGRVRAADGP